MSGYVKIPEEWLANPEVEDLPADVILFHLSALAHSARHLTDGVIRTRDLRKLWPRR